VGYLVDTHVALWAMDDDPRFGPEARVALADPLADVVVSVASVWEMAIKVKIGKLRAPDDLVQALEATGVEILSINAEHALAAAALPLHHRDPFDRMLVAQATLEGHTLVSADAALRAYEIDILTPDR